MLFELIAVVTAGFAAGGVALLARRIARALPRWVVPVAAGAAMLIAAISLEYSWYGRTSAALPADFEVATVNENRAPWRPWTYLAPYVDRFVAVDRASLRTHPEAEARRMADVLLFGRWTPPVRVQSVFDCETGRRADLLEGATLTADGGVEGARWIETGLDDPLTATVCAEGQA